MSLNKIAQSMAEADDKVMAHSDVWDDLEASDIVLDEDELDEEEEDEDKDDKDNVLEMEGELVVQIDDEPPVKKEFDFVLPLVPGGDFQDEICDPEDLDVEVEDEDDKADVKETIAPKDMWDWKGHGGVPKFTEWLYNMMTKNVPKHSGHDSVGLERVIAYFEKLDKMISQAVRADLKGELDISYIEKARDEIHKAVVRLTERYNRVMKSKYKRSMSEDDSLVKNAQKSTHVGGIVVTVPLFISHCARVCINSSVAGGKDIEKTYETMCKKYNLSDREKAELLQLIADMGYPIFKDRGMFLDDEIDLKSEDNVEWSANYPA